MSRSRTLEAVALAGGLAAQLVLFARPLHNSVSYDEAVYLAGLDALRHGQALGSQVFSAQFPGFYDLLRGLSYITGIGLTNVRAGMLAVAALGSIGGYLLGRRYGGPIGGLLVVAFLTIAPPLDLWQYQVIADTPCLALMLLALGLATLPGPAAAAGAGAALGAALSVKPTALLVVPALVWLLRRRSGIALGAAAAVFGAVLLAHVGALGDLWTSAITYHREAGSTPAVLPHPHQAIFHQIPRNTPFAVLAIVGAVVAAVYALLRRPLGTWALWVWVGLTIVVLLVYKPLHDNHLIAFPYALAVAAAVTIGAAVARIRTRTFTAVAVAVLVAAIVPGYVQQWHRVTTGLVPQDPAAAAAARALDRITAPGAVTVDDHPIVSFLAHRRVEGPLVDLAFLRFETGSLTDADVIDGARDADAVVVSRALNDRPIVLAYVKERFRLRYDRGGVRIWTR